MKLDVLSEWEKKTCFCTDFFLLRSCLCTHVFIFKHERAFRSKRPVCCPGELGFISPPSCHSLVRGSCSDQLPGHVGWLSNSQSVCVCVCVPVSYIFCFPIRWLHTRRFLWTLLTSAFMRGLPVSLPLLCPSHFLGLEHYKHLGRVKTSFNPPPPPPPTN